MSPKDEQVAFTVRLSREEHAELSGLADAEHRSLGAEARRAIVNHLSRMASAPDRVSVPGAPTS